MPWTDSLTAQPNDFSVIQGLLTQANGLAMDGIYQELTTWAAAQGKTLADMALEGEAISLAQYPGLSAIATLKSLGLIDTRDNANIGPTQLGIEFMAAMEAQEPTP